MPAPSHPEYHPLLEHLGTLVPNVLNRTTPPKQAPKGASEGVPKGESEGAAIHTQQPPIYPYNCQTS
eukprot:6151164-Ditylum_brightwellii.AAC.1